MSDFIRNAAIVIAIFLVSVAIYFLGSQLQKGELSEELEALGQKFIAMVPDGEGKEALNDYYGDFVDRVDRGEVAPREVERVAASILNASNTGRTLSPKEAESIIMVAMKAPKPPQPLEVPRQPEWKNLKYRLKQVSEFSEMVHQKEKVVVEIRGENPETLPFTIGEDLQIVMDSSFQQALNHRELANLAIEVDKLKKEGMLRWEADFEQKMAAHGQQIAADVIMLLKDSEEIEVDSMLRNVDSMLQDVQKQLKDAGVEVEIK